MNKQTEMIAVYTAMKSVRLRNELLEASKGSRLSNEIRDLLLAARNILGDFEFVVENTVTEKATI